MATTPSNTCSNVSAGFAVPQCAFAAGGINTIWFSTATGLTFTFDVDNQITAITGGSFYRYDLVQETGEQTEKVVTNIQNTSQHWAGEITLVIPKKSVAMRQQVKALASSGSYIITLDNNGQYRLFGYSNRCYMLDGASNTGRALSDANNYVLKFSSKESQESFFIAAGPGSGFTSSY